jgi:hypothetical protein
VINGLLELGLDPLADARRLTSTQRTRGKHLSSFPCTQVANNTRLVSLSLRGGRLGRCRNRLSRYMLLDSEPLRVHLLAESVARSALDPRQGRNREKYSHELLMEGDESGQPRFYVFLQFRPTKLDPGIRQKHAQVPIVPTFDRAPVLPAS